MDFWTHQENARRNTSRLILLYAAVVLLLAFLGAFAIDLAWSEFYPERDYYNYNHQVYNDYYGLDTGLGALDQPAPEPASFFSARFLLILVIIPALVLGMSLFSPASRSSGGQSVAEAMDGVLVAPQTTDSGERRLLNVVEEMALAGGVPVPPVYILKSEPGINAFAAGGSINDAVIGVTRGAVELLDRSELQAVIAHEFSHVVNGDMRINMRFAQLLFGFMCLAELGRVVMRGMGRGSSRRSSNSKGQGLVLLIALVCFVLGLLTGFLGRIVQAGVNRQREFLADASAVQFTRSPALAGALKKIGGLSQGSKLSATPLADNYSHFFFSSTRLNLLSTHPPLDQRILRIDPQWNGAYPTVEPLDLAAFEKENGAESGVESELTPGRKLTEDWAGYATMTSATVAAAATSQTNAAPIAPLPPSAALNLKPDTADAALQKLRAACREPLDACQLMFALLLDKNPVIQIKQFMDSKAARTKSAIMEYKQAFDLVAPEEYVPLIELAVPALKNLSQRQYESFQTALLAFIQADNEFSFKEWILYQLIISQVGAQYAPATARRGIKAPPYNEMASAAETLLTALARLEPDPAKAGPALAAGLKAMLLPATDLPPKPAPETLARSLETLQRSPERIRDNFLYGALGVIAYDKQLTTPEAMFLRATSLCLARPVPQVAYNKLLGLSAAAAN